MNQHEKAVYKAIKDANPRLTDSRCTEMAQSICNVMEREAKKRKVKIDLAVQKCTDFIYGGGLVSVANLGAQAVVWAQSDVSIEIEEEE